MDQRDRHSRRRSRLRYAAAPDLPARSCIPRPAPSAWMRRRNTAPCPRSGATATTRRCTHRERNRSARRGCVDRQGRSRTTRTRRTGRRKPGHIQSLPTRRGAALLPALEPEDRPTSSRRRPDLRAADLRDGEAPTAPSREPLPASRHRLPAPRRTTAPGCGPSNACRHAANRRRTKCQRFRVRDAGRYRTAAASEANRQHPHSRSLPCSRWRRQISPFALRYSMPFASICPAESSSSTRVTCAPVMIVRFGRRSASPSRKAR